MTVISSKPVSARVLDAAIAWQLSLDSGDGSAVEQEEFDKAVTDWELKRGFERA